MRINMNNTKLLEMKHVKKSFGNTEVLKDISLEVAEGEVVAIIGPSGSGKSTLLRCATLLETMDGGTLSYCGISATVNKEGETTQYVSKDELRSLKNNFGLVFQNFNLFPHYSVMKNVTDAPVHVQKRDKKEVYEEAVSLLEKVGLADKADSYPCQLSGGQQQRVAIARALAMNPKMLFFDEPTSALDPEITAGILKVLRELADEKMTMVIVTHEIDFARKVADRVIFMDGGVIVEQGRPEDVIDNPDNERTKVFLQKLAD
jgi:polar amino acid transport system ATP-binding protein